MPEPEPLDTDTEALARQATYLQFDRDSSSESKARAQQAGDEVGISTESRALGRAGVVLPDGDSYHETLLVKAPDGTHAGACDCDGFAYHDGPCAHLWSRKFAELLKSHEIPESVQYFETMTTTGTAETDDDDDAADEPGDEAAGLDPDEVPETRAEAGQGASPPEPAPTPSAPAQTRDDAFAQSLPNVDDQFVMELGDDTYIRKAGYARLLHEEGYRVVPEIVSWPWEGDRQRCVAKGVILDGDDTIVSQNYGTAGPPDDEELTGAENNLIELAVTRAWTRAAGPATGEGRTALVEVHPGKDPAVGD